jgi:hypothetical protein
MATPKVLLVQLLQVKLRLPGKALPSACVPVNMSCLLDGSNMPLRVSPLSVIAVAG